MEFFAAVYFIGSLICFWIMIDSPSENDKKAAGFYWILFFIVGTVLLINR